MTMDRRQFLRLTGTGTVLGLLGAVKPPDSHASDRVALAHPELLGLLGQARVRAIGVRYRRDHPAEADTPALRRAILQTSVAHAAWTGPVAVAELVRADFAAGRTIVVDGWLLSLTEARQCALHSLLPA